ncbi:Phage integrase family protein [Gordonia malaquae]|uniref:Putative recombinase n=1 Tax=Gordonia malaquae NBRC 108250 TaxID=1223542 RepID=M3UTU6_GORML|nr:tyrosine-type recombinase/integrase [Gordonia malaquae]GAC78792.1 putative recombinase [Gordonia malaquae NBRC 108250]SED66390.1 Phage integrase family protein [Gordonia malaquae]
MAEAFGIIDKRGKRYRARYTAPDPLGLTGLTAAQRRISAPHTFETKKLARTWLAQIQASIANGTWKHPDVVAAEAEAAAAEAERQATIAAQKSIPAGEYAAKWIDTRANSKGEPLAATTRYNYENLWRPAEPKRRGHRAKPAGRLYSFAAVPIDEITAEMVREWHSTAIRSGKATAVARAYDHLRAVLHTAVEDDLIDKSPCQIKGASRASTGIERDPPTDDELAVVLSTIPDRYVPLVIMAGFAGLRYGEASAMRAGDLAIERNEHGDVACVRLPVGEAISYTPTSGRQRGKTKTRNSRTVPVFGIDAAALAAAAEGRAPDELLCPSTTTGGPLPHSTFAGHWDVARTKAGRPDLAFHSLRAYDGTRFAQTGATLKEIMARLGHTTVEAAMRYQKAGTRDDELARKMAR